MSEISLDNIDWSRVAEPQDDGYDTRVTLYLATTTASPLRAEPYARRAVEGCHSICEGRVAVRYLERTQMAAPAFKLAPPDHPNLHKAVEYVRRWPAVYEQLKSLVDTIHPCLDQSIQPEYRDIFIGSSSHSDEQQFGAVCVTVDHPVGCAQALVREMAHQKLRALGVSLEQAWRLIANDPARYPSPLNAAATQPMTAVLHAHYSLAYVTQLDICMLAGESKEPGRDSIIQLLLRNMVRLEAGYEILAGSVKTDEAGAAFMDGLLRWSWRAIEQAHRMLNENGYETLPATLPEAPICSKSIRSAPCEGAAGLSG